MAANCDSAVVKSGQRLGGAHVDEMQLARFYTEAQAVAKLQHPGVVQVFEINEHDGLPYIGPHRNFPHHLFAFGDSSRSLTGAYLASRMLLRLHLDELESADRHFSFTRHGG